MRHSRFPFVIAMVLLAAAHIAAQGGGYKVVVHPSNPLTSVSKDEVSRIFMKKSKTFGDGRKASPVDLPLSSSVRDAFSRTVLGKPASAVGSYWQQQIFSGRDVPPPLRDEDAAISFVLANEAGIAYVSAAASTAGVKVVTIAE